MGVKVAQTPVCDSLAMILPIETKHRLKSMLLEKQSAPLVKKESAPAILQRPTSSERFDWFEFTAGDSCWPVRYLHRRWAI
ncbi:MAG: hypothetical protein DMF74_13500 [Acidobacteria bacterium]|nr:MAG: hypothetical protein DMF74_13500 [Acidobacteriota bacterium]